MESLYATPANQRLLFIFNFDGKTMTTPHTLYTCTARAWWRILLGRALPLPVLALLFVMMEWAHVLPRAFQTGDMDETVVSTKVELARQSSRDSQSVYIGDSTCLMNVDTRELGGLNLGLLSYLTFDAYTEIIHVVSARTNPPPGQVVLIIHPSTLRRAHSEPHFLNVLRQERDGQRTSRTWLQSMFTLTGIPAARERVYARIFPSPLPPRFVDAYGHTHNLRRALLASAGNLTGGHARPDTAIPRGRPEYRMPPPLESHARAFRDALPTETRVFIALSPTRESDALSDTPARYAALNETLKKWLVPATVLELPVTMPDDCFVDRYHLTAEARRTYTATLSSAWE